MKKEKKITCDRCGDKDDYYYEIEDTQYRKQGEKPKLLKMCRSCGNKFVEWWREGKKVL